MRWILIAGIALTGIGILVGLCLPILAAQFVVPEKIRVCAIAGAMLVVIGTAMEIVPVWPTHDAEQTLAAPSLENRRKNRSPMSIRATTKRICWHISEKSPMFW